MGCKVLLVSNASKLILEIDNLFVSTDDFLLLGIDDTQSTFDLIRDFAPDIILYDARKGDDELARRITDFKVERLSLLISLL